MFTKENIPNSSLDNFFSAPLLLLFEQEATVAGSIAVAPNNAELVKKSLRFMLIILMFEFKVYSTQLVHFWLSLQPDLTTVSMNCIPLTPSLTFGKSSILVEGFSPLMPAITVSVKFL